MASHSIEFEWDPAKATSNASKHGVRFETACGVFSDPQALTIFDADHSRGEDRWITLGLDNTLSLLVVCHTHRTVRNRAVIRIISARKATKNEAKRYYTPP